jgi:Uncharacterized conserved protein
MKFVIEKATNGQYYFNIKAGNGQILCTSETYIVKQSAKDAIQSIKTNASTATTEDNA